MNGSDIMDTQNFELPEWIPRKEWEEWMAARPKKASKRPETLNRHVTQLDIIRKRGFDLKEVLLDAADAGWQGIKAKWSCFDVKDTSLAEAKAQDLKDLREEAERQEQWEREYRGY